MCVVKSAWLEVGLQNAVVAPRFRRPIRVAGAAALVLLLAAPTGVGAQARLDGLAVSGIEAGGATRLPLFPAFPADATIYAANARLAHVSARIVPSASVGAIAIDGFPIASGTGYDVSLQEGVNAFAIVVDTGATSTAYTLNITRLPFALTLPSPGRVAGSGVAAGAGWRQPVPLSATTASQPFQAASPFGVLTRNADAWADVGACAYAARTLAGAPKGGAGRWCPGSLLRPYYVASGPSAPLAGGLALTQRMIDDGGLVFVADSGRVPDGPDVAEWVPVRSTSPNLSALDLLVGTEELALDAPFDNARTRYQATTGECARLTVAAPAAQSRVHVSITPADADGDALGHQVVFAPGDSEKTVRVAAVAETGAPIAKSWEVRVSVDPDAASYCGRNPPESIQALGNRFLDVGETFILDLYSWFRDIDGDALAFAAASSNEDAALVLAREGLLRAWGAANGVSTIRVSAEDATGLRVEQTFEITVGHALTVHDATVLEGGTARLRVELEPPRDVATAFSWRVRPDGGVNGARANAGEHGDATGEATLPAGRTSIEVALPIADDGNIEAARESFLVAIEPLEDTIAVRRGEAVVTVLEGVCDRTAGVREALSGGLACAVPTAADLLDVRHFRLRDAGIASLATDDLLGLPNLRVLDLGGNALAALPAGLLDEIPAVRFLILDGNRLSALAAGTFSRLSNLVELRLDANNLVELAPGTFSGLTSLRSLRLDGNGLRQLPARIFAGLGTLRSLRLDGNPGAPFELPLRLLRSDSEPHAPAPAMLHVAVAQGIPFDVEVRLAAEDGALSTPDGRLATGVLLAAGETTSGSVLARPTGNAQAVHVAAEVPSVPATRCNGVPCWQGIELAVDAPLLLFARAPTARALRAPAPLFGNTLRLPLGSLFEAGTVAGGLSFQATSSDRSVAAAKVVGGELVVVPAPFAEGRAQVEVVATDAAGLSARLRFDVQVQFVWPVRQAAGWRGALGAADAEASPRDPAGIGGRSGTPPATPR